MLFDTHVHLLSSRFDADRESIIRGLAQNGVGLILEAGCEEGPDGSIPIVEKYEMVYASAGIHPHEAKDFTGEDIKRLRQMLSHPKVKAVGEIGLDFHYDFSPRDVQKQIFEMQLELAAELKKPVIIHSREAAKDTLEMLQNYKNRLKTGVMHCYSGSIESAREYLNIGFYISFAGPLTFENARHIREVAAFVPLDRALVETDCPYLTPIPFRGKRNEPKYVRYIAEELARIKGLPYETVEKTTYDNGKTLFDIT